MKPPADPAPTPEEAVVTYHRMVCKLARKYHFFIRNQTIDDLYQIGMAAVLKSIRYFDPSFGVSFFTYAYEAVCREMRKSDAHSRVIRVPAHIYNLRQPGYERTGHLREKGDLARKIGSLSDAFGESDSILANIIPDRRDQFAELEDLEIDAGNRSRAAAFLEVLEDRELLAVKLKFGFGCEPHSLEQIGRKIGGVSRERARQVIEKALGKMRSLARCAEAV